MDESSLNKQAQAFFRESIDAYEAVLRKPIDDYPLSERMMTLRQLSGCYLKLESGDISINLTKAVQHCMEALSMAQSMKDDYMTADLTGLLGSCTFELGIETDSVNLVHEAISYHIESAKGYAKWDSYWQQQSMHYGYAAYCIECLPDGDTIPNAKRRIGFYERILDCLPSEVPESYLDDINERLLEAKSRVNEE